MRASQYAKALYEMGGDPGHIRPLRAMLERRGQEKMLPQILREYQKLEQGAARLKKHKKITPERERLRVLLELYRALIHTHA